MAGAPNPRIVIELEASTEPIRGSIELAGGERHAFWGWLQLIDELRRAATGDPHGLSRPERE